MPDEPAAVDCVALQIPPSACAELLTPAPPPDGAGWLILAMILAAALGGFLMD